VSGNREDTPPLPKPFIASIQATFQQGAASYQFAGYGHAIALQPDSAEANYTRGSALKEQKRLAEALAAFDRAIALKPDYAEAHNSRGIVLANLDRFDEAIAGFDGAIALKPDYAEAHNNRGIVLQDLRRLDDALANFDKAIALQPGNARAHNNRGVALHDLKRLDDALASHDKAIALKPDYSEAYYNRGIVLQDLKRLDDALADFERAIGLKPNYAPAHNNRGVVLANLNRLDDAVVGFDGAISLKPDDAEAYNNRGNVLQDLNRFDDAIADFDKAIALMPNFAEAYGNQGYCLLKMGRFEQGWRLHEWRKKTERPVGNRSFRQPLWLGGEDVANRTLFVHWEQGLGDTIQFCRYGKLLKARGARVVMSVQEPLYRLLQQMCPDIKVIGHNEVPAGFDYHCPLMSLPLALGTTLQNIPSEKRYIFADEQLRRAWDIRLPPQTKPRIGVVWRGSPQHRNDHNRSIDLPTLAPLFSADAHWISLQKELRLGDRALLEEPHKIVHYGDELKDFSDTAAVLDLLDLVITVDTSVAHLAGAMGKLVWILLPYKSDWRWLSDRDDSPWYPTARLFRQDDMHSWKNLIARVRAALCDFVQI